MRSWEYKATCKKKITSCLLWREHLARLDLVVGIALGYVLLRFR